MVSSTSGSTSFNMDVDEIIEEALDLVGGEHTSGEEAAKARRKLNLILIELANKGVPLSKLNNLELTLVSGTSTYELDGDIVDILELNLKRDDIESPLLRYGEREWQEIPTKTQVGRPSVFTTERNRDNVKLKLWPITDKTTDTVTYLVTKRIEDVNASYQRVDLPYRYLPLLVSWLGYKVSLTRQGIDSETKERLKRDYNEMMVDAFDEDGERASFFVRPGGISGW